MGTLAPPFILCPLADSKEFLGMSGDQEESKVILTIGKNIAIRYHVSEQKQEVSWASSRHWLTSRVVYCPDFQKYGAAIDHSTVGLWPEHDGHLATLKKYKYADPIFELKPTKTLGTLVVFKNGRVVPLSCHEREEKQTLPIDLRVDQDQEHIIAVDVDEKSSHIFLTCGNLSKEKPTSKCGIGKLSRVRVVTLKMESALHDSSTLVPPPPTTKVIRAVEVFLDTPSILGSCVIPNGENSTFVYLCGDGFLYRRRLIPEMSSDEIGVWEEGSRIGNLSKYISRQSAVVIKCVDFSTIAIFGGDVSEEGGVVCIYDVTYDLLLSKQSLKLYSVPPIMEKVGLSIFVPVGLHILVLGLRITKSLLSSVVGRHQLQSLDLFENKDPWVRGWGDDEELERENETLALNDAPEGVTGFQDFLTLVKTLENHGQPQSVICGQVIPTMIEQRNFGALNWSLGYFTDIPEPLLVTILTFLLSSIEKTERTRGSTGERSTYPSNGQINQVLDRPFDQRQMIRSLRSMDFEVVKKFLDYLCSRLESSWEDELEETRAERLSHLIKWICTTFDAHYPHFVFHNETGIVDSLLSLVEEKSKVMRDLEGLEPLLVSAIAKVSFQPTPSPNSKFRTETVLFE